MDFKFIVAAAIVIFISMFSIVADKPWERTIRLLPNIRPQQYHINLYPNLDDGLFSGYVNITILLTSTQSYIVLHSNELNITETKLNSNCVTAFLYPENQYLVVVPNEELCAGEYILQISFKGSLLDKIEGFYRSAYTNSKSPDQHYIANTQFEPTYARSTFPCFDEPIMKANFKISVIRPSGDKYIALSNMNKECEEVNVPTNGLTTVHFANTPPMSTYLVNFILCDFKSLDPVKTDQGFLFTVYARSDQIEKMKYAQQLGLKVINFYVEYFKIPYALPKLDLIAIFDLDMPSMQAWGIVAFLETQILYEEGLTSKNDEKNIVLVLCHELSHMWCGDLTTLKWWNDLWIVEGFANFMKFKALQVVYPDWDADTLCLTEIVHTAQEQDSLPNSHPIVVEVSNPDEINGILDTITFRKSSSVLRMLEEAVSEEKFRIGLNAYFKRFAFKNAETDDLWVELQAATQNTVHVKEFMDTWIVQMGFPMVSAIRNGTKLILKQQRFLAFSIDKYPPPLSPFNYKWEIPMTYITSNDKTVTKFWFCKDNDAITMDIPNVEWIKINHRQVGFYIVNYSKNDWCLFSHLLEKNVNAICAADRANLVNDAFMLAKNSYIPYDIALDMTKYFFSEYHYIPWKVFENKINELRDSLFQRPALQNLEKYIQHLFKSLKEDILNDSSERNFQQANLQQSILDLGCLNGIPSYLTKVHELFKQFLDDKVQPQADIKETVYNYGIYLTDECEWNKTWDLYLNEQEPREKNKLLIALTASKDTLLLNRLLQYGKNENYISSINYLFVLKNMCKNPDGNQVVWDFLKNEWPCLVARLSPEYEYVLGGISGWVCNKFNTCEQLEEVKVFFEKYPEAGQNMALDLISDNIKWLECHEADINNWLMNCM